MLEGANTLVNHSAFGWYMFAELSVYVLWHVPT